MLLMFCKGLLCEAFICAADMLGLCGCMSVSGVVSAGGFRNCTDSLLCSRGGGWNMVAGRCREDCCMAPRSFRVSRLMRHPLSVSVGGWCGLDGSVELCGADGRAGSCDADGGAGWG